MSKNAERNAEIIRRVKAGERFADIAAAIGVTKNAVIGVVHRAGLSDPQRWLASQGDTTRRKRLSELSKARWEDPAYRAANTEILRQNMKALQADPEFRARHVARMKARHAAAKLQKMTFASEAP